MVAPGTWLVVIRRRARMLLALYRCAVPASSMSRRNQPAPRTCAPASSTRVLVLTMFDLDEYVFASLSARLSGLTAKLGIRDRVHAAVLTRSRRGPLRHLSPPPGGSAGGRAGTGPSAG